MAQSKSHGSDAFDEAFLEKLDYLYIVSRKIAAGVHQAKRKTRMVGSGIDFADHRHYTPGDDVRNLDWRVYRRTEKLFLKLYEEEEDLHIYFLVDTSRSMQIGSPNKWSMARNLAAALAYIGLCNLDRVSIVPFSSNVSDRMAPTRGKAQIFKIFNFLERCEPGQTTTLDDAFRTFVRENKRPGLAVVISDFYDPRGFQEGLDILRYHRFEPMVSQLYDEREFQISVQGDVELVDCETGEVRQLTVTPAMMREYTRVFEEFCDELKTYCTRRQILYFRSPIQQSFEELVLKIFRAGGFLQ